MKKRIALTALSVLCVLLLALGVAACGKKGNKEPELVSITLNTDEVQKEFTEGDAFNHDHLIVTAHYDDDSEKDVVGYNVSTPDLTTAGTKTVTVTYQEKTATYEIVVISVSGRVLEGISLDLSGVQRTFAVGAVFSWSGLVVKANYEGGLSIAVSDYTVNADEIDTRIEGTRTVLVSYRGFTAGYEIAVGNAALPVPDPDEDGDPVPTGLMLDTTAVRKVFTTDEQFSAEGLVVYLIYDNSIREEVSSGYSILAPDISEPGEKTVVVRCRGQEASYTVTVKIAALTAETEGMQLVYTTEDEALETEGLVVISHTDEGDRTLGAEEYVLSEVDFTEPGEKTVTVSFEDSVAKFTVYVLPAEYIDRFALDNVTEGSEARLTVYVTEENIPDASLRQDRGSSGWLFFELGEGSYRLIALSTQLNTWATVFTFEDEDGRLSVRYVNRVENREDYGQALEVIYDEITFLAAQTDWHWGLLRWNFVRLEVSNIGAASTEYAVGDAFSMQGFAQSTLRVWDEQNYAEVLFVHQIVVDWGTESETADEAGFFTGKVVYAHGDTQLVYEFPYSVMPAVNEETDRLDFNANFTLLITGRSGMADPSEDGAASGYYWYRNGSDRRLIPFSYTYTAEGEVHVFTAENAEHAINEDGSLSVTFNGSVYKASEKIWKKFICGWMPLARIEADLTAVTTEYKAGETFTAEGLKLKLWYEFTEEPVVIEEGFDVQSVVIPGVMELTDPATLTVRITYEDVYGTFETSYNIHVATVPVLGGITLDTDSVLKQFKTGSALTWEGLVVTAHFQTNPKDVLLEDGQYEVIAPDMSSAGTKTVTVSYEYDEVTMTQTYEIVVTDEEVVLTGLELELEGVKRVFYVGNTFTREGLVVYAVYNDDSARRILVREGDFTVDPPDMDTAAASAEVTVSYGGVSATYTVEIKILPDVASLRIEFDTFSPIWERGSAFAMDGIKVMGVLSDGAGELELEDYTYTRPDIAAMGEQVITVDFEGLTASFSIFVIPGEDDLYRGYKIETTGDATGYRNGSGSADKLTLYITDLINAFNNRTGYTLGWYLLEKADGSFAMFPFEMYYSPWTPVVHSNAYSDLKTDNNMVATYNGVSFTPDRSVYVAMILGWNSADTLPSLYLNTLDVAKTYRVSDPLNTDHLAVEYTEKRGESNTRLQAVSEYTVSVIAPDGTRTAAEGGYTFATAGEYEIAIGYNGAEASYRVVVLPAGFEASANNTVTFTDASAGSVLTMYVTERGEGTAKGYFVVQRGYRDNGVNANLQSDRYEMYAFTATNAGGEWSIESAGVLERAKGAPLTVTVHGVVYTASETWREILVG